MGSMSTPTPGEGARRSRRGYYFQDLCALRHCLAMADGRWTAVTSDGDEDITSASEAPAIVEYCQIKTEEFPRTPWTVARLCEAERSGDRATSILGRLFLDKPLPDPAMFRLVGNVPLHPDLRPLTPGAASSRDAVITAIGSRLGALPLRDGRSIRWCLERLEVENVAGNADALEAMALRELGATALRLSVGLLPNELETLLEGLIGYIQTTAREVNPAPIARDDFAAELRSRGAAATRATSAAAGPGAPTLSDKLAAAGVGPEQIAAFQQTHFEFTRTYRSSLPHRTAQLDDLTERIRMACVELSLRRREGSIMPGAEMFAATNSAVRDLHSAGDWEGRGIPLTIAYGVLHDVTARCQHRYD
jgi:hypothetical protein